MSQAVGLIGQQILQLLPVGVDLLQTLLQASGGRRQPDCSLTTDHRVCTTQYPASLNSECRRRDRGMCDRCEYLFEVRNGEALVKSGQEVTQQTLQG